MTKPRPRVFIHADESCLGNQYSDRDSPGGAAVLLETWKDGQWERRDLWTSDPSTTNNRMALTSAIVALEVLKAGCEISFVSDSQYLVKGVTEWMPSWKRRGWKRKAGPIENLDLWKRLDALLPDHSIRWEWVRGHAGHPKNEYVNDLAIEAASELTAVDTPVASGFEAWLEAERHKGRYLDFHEFEPPPEAG